MKIRTVCLLLLAAIAMGAALYPVNVLQIEAQKKKAVFFVRSVRPGDRFSLMYRHSVELCLIWDHFRIDKEERIVLDETVFASSNTGLPSVLTGEERFTRGATSSRISNMKRVLPAIEIWVDRRYDNTLEFDGQKVCLAELAGNTLLRIQIRKLTWAEYVYHKLHSLI